MKNYNQYCPIAHSLDLIGDRWTLLIVRDLLLGPKRFSDLVGGLPGIGTNLLTERLRQLEQAEVIQRRTLPPPAASQVYELTPRGCELEGPLTALAHWGAQTLGALRAEQAISRDTVVLTARAVVRGWPATSAATTYHVQIEDERYTELLVFHGAGPTADRGPGGAGDTLVTLRLDLATLFAIAGERLTPQAAVDQGRLQIEEAPAAA